MFNLVADNMKNLLTDLEMQIEIEDLRNKGLTEDEIAGYFEFYADSWVADKQQPREMN